MGGASKEGAQRFIIKTQVSGAAPAPKPLHPKRVDYKLERDNNIKSSISVMRPSQSCEINQLVFFFFFFCPTAHKRAHSQKIQIP